MSRGWKGKFQRRVDVKMVQVQVQQEAIVEYDSQKHQLVKYEAAVSDAYGTECL